MPLKIACVGTTRHDIVNAMVQPNSGNALYIDDAPGSAADRLFRDRIDRAAASLARTDAALGMLESGTFFRRKLAEMQSVEIEPVKIAA